MTRRAKLSCLALALLLAALTLAGCHGSQGRSAFEVPEQFDTSRNFEISFWAKNDTNKTQTEIYKKAISDFEALYPNIKVSMKLYTDYGRIYNDVITNIATETTPSITWIREAPEGCPAGRKSWDRSRPDQRRFLPRWPSHGC